MLYNDQQIAAIKHTIEWYFCKSYKNNLMCINGFAGTGKTTIVKVIIKMLGLSNYSVIFCTLTGKASLNLRLKGNPANTIHKTFYATYKTKGTFKFKLKNKISPAIKLIVLDEFSMVNQKMFDEILSFGIPVIALGDTNQLPPIFNTNIFMVNPSLADISLTDVMRQDDKSGILDLATMAREGTPIPHGKYKDSEVTTFDEIIDRITDFDVVLCWKNSTRRKLNAYIRHKLGFEGVYPQKGEKILCLVNNYNYEIDYNDIPIYIINGLQGIVRSDSYIENNDDLTSLHLEFMPEFIKNSSEDSFIFKIPCFKETFDQYKINVEREAFIELLVDESIDDGALDMINLVDFGYSLTTHKAQGSEWERVLVVNDYRGSRKDYNNWIYSSITRASKELVIATL